MWKTPAVTALFVATLSAGAAAEDAKSVIEDATLALGAAGMSSIVYQGSAAQGNFGQSRTISFGLASTAIRNYTRAIDFTQPASRTIGDTQPPAVRGGPVPQPGTIDQIITPANTAWAQQLQIWVTPWGFLKGAAANQATMSTRKIDGTKYKVITWSPAQKAPSGQPCTPARKNCRSRRPSHPISQSKPHPGWNHHPPDSIPVTHPPQCLPSPSTSSRSRSRL